MKRDLFFLLLIIFTARLSALPYNVYDLTCEQEENPVGLDLVTPHFSWKITSGERGVMQTSYQIMVSSSIKDLQNGKGNAWDSGKLKSDESILIPYKGRKLISFQTYYWKIRSWNNKGEASDWSIPAHFTMGLLSVKDWNGAQWITLEREDRGKRVVKGYTSVGDVPNIKNISDYKNPQFRKEFEVSKTIKRAYAFVSGLGEFDFFINGTKVSNHLFDPGWTNYDEQALYVPFDVTNLLYTGRNAIGLMLGGGFYYMPKERYLKFYNVFGAPKMKMELYIEYTDGSVSKLVSNSTWKASKSPITLSSVYGGEDYDATKYQKGWMLPGYDDSNWSQALVSDYNVPMSVQRYAPVTVRQELPPVHIYKNKVGYWIYDLGQNASGNFRLKVKGKCGQKVTIRPGELLNDDGSVDQWASGSPTSFSYTISSDNEETWHPQFSYYGFRYLQVEGAEPYDTSHVDSLPQVVELVGLHTSNSAPEVGHFTCSKPMFNKVHDLIDWAIQSNMSSILTDCPHREKLGWLEQDYLMQYSLQYRYDLARLYKKIVRDMQESQTNKGVIPSICPEYVHFSSGFEDSPEWGSAFIISPYYYYLWYGDKSLLQNYYSSMKKYIDYLGIRADNHIISYGLGDWYDLGKNAPGFSQLTSNGVTATGIYYYDVTIMQKISELLNRKEDVNYYDGLAKEIKKSFNDKFFNKETCNYDRGSQTANAIPLCFGIVEPQYKQKVFDNLVKDIQDRGNALTAGDIGYRFVLRVLEENNRQDVIYDMNSRYDVPGYGYQLAHGATSLTEAWNALRTSSNNHFMLGHIMEWFYGWLGGIRQHETSCAYKNIIIDPHAAGDVTDAFTSYDSPYGRIECEWKIENNEYVLRTKIPANTRAMIYLPTDNVNAVTEYGESLNKRSDLKVTEKGNSRMALSVGSGEYLFKVKLK
jgi:alpha-L-rhamnosidase